MSLETALRMDGQAWKEIAHHHAQWHRSLPPRVAPCGLGAPFARGDVRLGEKTIYILGFNAGEPEDPSTDGPHTSQARKWVRRCERMQAAAGASGFISIERCYWGSPRVGDLIARVGSAAALRDLLRQHAKANISLFEHYPPLVVWIPGVATYLQEAVEDYGLGEPLEIQIVERKGRRHTLWRLYKNRDGVPFLFSKHPASRPSASDWDSVEVEVSKLAAASRDARP